MATKAGKPQYKTLVRALEQLVEAVNRAYGPVQEGGGLGRQMAALQLARDSAREVAERARTAMARKQEVRDANQR